MPLSLVSPAKPKVQAASANNFALPPCTSTTIDASSQSMKYEDRTSTKDGGRSGDLPKCFLSATQQRSLTVNVSPDPDDSIIAEVVIENCDNVSNIDGAAESTERKMLPAKNAVAADTTYIDETVGRDTEVCTSNSNCGPSPRKRRRSRRNTNRIVFSSKSTLEYQRLDQLFFRENEDSPANFRLGNLTLRRLTTAPSIYAIDNFLNESELAYFDKHIEKGSFQKSFIDIPDTQEASYDGQHRTSTFISFQKQHDRRISAVEHKAAELLGCWSSDKIEPLQLVRYRPGQFFGVHHDMGDLTDDGHVELPPKSLFCRRRLVTIFCYLNDVEEGAGGATLFPQVGLAVRPIRGKAVVFSNVLPNGLPDPRTVHSGTKVVSSNSIKYGLNIWVCEG